MFYDRLSIAIVHSALATGRTQRREGTIFCCLKIRDSNRNNCPYWLVFLVLSPLPSMDGNRIMQKSRNYLEFINTLYHWDSIYWVETFRAGLSITISLQEIVNNITCPFTNMNICQTQFKSKGKCSISSICTILYLFTATFQYLCSFSFPPFKLVTNRFLRRINLQITFIRW